MVLCGTSPGNENFQYTIEAPHGVAKDVFYFKMVEADPEMVGGSGGGGTRVTLDFCKFHGEIHNTANGQRVQKRTDIWTNNKPIIRECGQDVHPMLCCKDYPCCDFKSHTHVSRDCKTDLVTPFPEGLCDFMVSKVEESVSFLRLLD